MNLPSFTRHDFDTFHIEGLEPRMEAIRERIQPKFKTIGDALADQLSDLTGEEMFLHIAKHARRKTNPPNDTWLALAHNHRGYKKHPHFQVGLFDDHLFIWLAYIYELPNKKEIAQVLLEKQEQLEQLPSHFALSLDHTQKNAQKLGEMKSEDLHKSLIRFRDVKKGEFLIGQQIGKNDPLLNDGNQLLSTIMQTFKKVHPFYEQTIQIPSP
ncbi:uncharacterized protein YktB (UPF0637 family) [Geomicrobium halophilum]|uniref:UPF0637 protein HNR44_001387 n=1 Tax=Geomicrobium halophilum TaxID=549000 RepID=A0A841Q149_9BACL|nr:DUF1054 domain-containing protein [Geomicrobium halophilum]MBB6449438.1 uncharacterized protein YktB (UPF0637 family) [Geomicrobium halophilum]